ncbi:MAG: RNA polymerase sigma factor [Planctomycetota bacterium]|jgi:RNA polymerase sigma-70 factor (ECF subfamily)
MMEDKVLIWRLKRGRGEALKSIYAKYKRDMLALASALLNDKSIAEDVVHDVFVSFSSAVKELEIRSSLKSYLLTSIANRVQSIRATKAKFTNIKNSDVLTEDTRTPERMVMSEELSELVNGSMRELPYEQQEVILLHLYSGLRFREIAKAKEVSINTVLSRYRYGLQKLQAMLDGEVTK